MAALGLLAAVAHAADPDALWKIVNGRCVPNAAAGNPAPCVEVQPDYAVLKDVVGTTQFLLIPTARIAGIESPAVLGPAAPNFFAAAWDARHHVEERAGKALPRDAVALAINPPGARSQNQLHIHIDCLQPDVRLALQTLSPAGGWTVLPNSLAGQKYAVLAVPGEHLSPNPFDLLAQGLPGASSQMDQYTLVVVGRSDGFLLLAGRIGEGRGHGEDLQDHSCALAAA